MTKDIQFVSYSHSADQFIDDAYKFVTDNPEYELYYSCDILEENNIEW